ncbi:MAG TPA: 23S rRNA (adenine(2503)-C(2))-methyltransferase RlmN, partial [Caldilineaceae bacterium]|nr:23S rRNA (adenine(2503)-C(2))-methyltransferase RlmN [Caldilineaceae bacterium]
MTEITLKVGPGQIEKRVLLDLSLEELTEVVTGLGQPVYRARQIWEWVYKHFAVSFDEMANLPKTLREKLAGEWLISPLESATRILSQDGDTQKVLFRLADGQTIETVLMLYDERRTLCISSQVGCAMGCTFCATAQGGLARNLTSGEIVA